MRGQLPPFKKHKMQTRPLTAQSPKTQKRKTQPPKMQPQPGERLLKLPSEIRLMIYEHMFPTSKIDVYAIKGSLHKAEDAYTVAGDHVAILSTCRAIYTEAKPVLYANTEFRIHVQDRYWLHLWPSETYFERFGVDDEDVEADPSLWIELNPWLGNPRSIVPLNIVRVLSLNIEANISVEGKKWTWTGQLKHTLREARHLEKLQIILNCEPELGFDQDETNKTLRTIGQIVKCGGAVTGKMSLVLGAYGFASASYYQMLAELKGVDETHEVFSKQLASVRFEHATMSRVLREKTAVLKSSTQELVNLTEKRSTWIGFDAVSQVALQLVKTMQQALVVMPGHYSGLQHTELEISSLQSHLESLLAGGKDVRRAV